MNNYYALVDNKIADSDYRVMRFYRRGSKRRVRNCDCANGLIQYALQYNDPFITKIKASK